MFNESELEIIRLSLEHLPSLNTSDKQQKKTNKRKHRVVVTQILLLHYLLRFYLKISNSYDRSVAKDDIIRDLGGNSSAVPEQALEYVSDNFCATRMVKNKPGTPTPQIFSCKSVFEICYSNLILFDNLSPILISHIQTSSHRRPLPSIISLKSPTYFCTPVTTMIILPHICTLLP